MGLAMGFRKEVHIRKWGRSKPLVEIFPEWLEYWDLNEGDKVIELGDSIIMIVPRELEGVARNIISNFPSLLEAQSQQSFNVARDLPGKYEEEGEGN